MPHCQGEKQIKTTPKRPVNSQRKHGNCEVTDLIRIYKNEQKLNREIIFKCDCFNRHLLRSAKVKIFQLAAFKNVLRTNFISLNLILLNRQIVN